MPRLALVTVLALSSLLLGQPPDLTGDAALWNDFAAWSANLKPFPPGHKSTLAQSYGLTLRARGISLAQAQSLLTFAFANDIIERLSIPSLRASLEKLLLEQEHLVPVADGKERA